MKASSSGRTQILLQTRHWPAVLPFLGAGDRLIVGGPALLAVLAEPDLPALMQRHGLDMPAVLQADCEAYGIRPGAGMPVLDDQAWVQVVAASEQGVIQW